MTVRSPRRPGQPGVDIKDEMRPLPGEPVVVDTATILRQAAREVGEVA